MNNCEFKKGYNTLASLYLHSQKWNIRNKNIYSLFSLGRKLNTTEEVKFLSIALKQTVGKHDTIFTVQKEEQIKEKLKPAMKFNTFPLCHSDIYSVLRSKIRHQTLCL